MEITFLIGNGFDLGVKLKTRYKDFYKEYCNETRGDNDNIRRFKETIRGNMLGDSKQIEDWSDFEFAFGQHSKEFSLQEKERYRERFEDFAVRFNSYLENEESNLDYSDEESIAKMMKEAVRTYSHIREADKNEIEQIYKRINNTRHFNFVSFNYTHVVDKFVEILRNALADNSFNQVGRMVHGYIEENMIIGVNDASQIANTKFSEDPDIVSELVKPQQNRDARTGYEREVTSIIESSHIICIYGMSIGATDKKWWDLIAKWLLKDPGRGLVILKKDDTYNPRFPHEQRRFTISVENKFLTHSSLTDEQKEKIRSQIYVGANHNVFEIELKRKSEEFLKLLNA